MPPEQPNQSAAPTTTPIPATIPVAPPPKSNFLASSGMTIGLLILAAVVLIGGFYVWGSRLTPEDLTTDPLKESGMTRTETPTKETPTSSSDELSAIEADLDGTASLDAEMAEMDAELDEMETEMNAH